MSSFVPGAQDADDSEARASLPKLAFRNGSLAMEHGLHQEIGWERNTDASGMSVLLYQDRVDTPVIEAMSHFAASDSGDSASREPMLFDRASGLLRAAGPDFSATGMLATFERNLPGGNRVRLSYANGDALLIQAAPSATTAETRPSTVAQVVAGTRPRRAQMYALALSGTLDGSGTRWRASYRWQPEDTVTNVAPFAVDSIEPYLSLHIRQPIRLCRDGSGRFEALLDVHNLLAEGYRPFLLNDGSLLVFAQDQRSVRAGVAFTF
jgi:hypothetical protein